MAIEEKADDGYSVILKFEEDVPLTEDLLFEWTERVNGTIGSARNKKIVIDASVVKALSSSEISSIARHFGYTAKKNQWRLVMICTAETEAAIDALGLSNLFQCFEVHQKKDPAKNFFPEEVDVTVLRREISIFFGHLVSCVERGSKGLFNVPFSYVPPLELLTQIDDEFESNESVMLRMDSGSMVYRIVFVMNDASKAHVANVAFKGREVAPEVLRDLLSELANTIMGDLTSQMSKGEPAIKLTSSIPEILAPKQLPLEKDLDVMKGRAALIFKAGEHQMKLIVGYSLKC